MIVRPLCAPPPVELAQALARFETQFTYPLGPGRFFRVSHGEDYPRFFRAMGEAACFVVERQGCVLGTVGAVRRWLVLPSGQERPVVYLGDLKVALAARGGRALTRLVQAVQQWAGTRAAAAFGVVMDGTPVTPVQYTGRLGIPPFRELGKIIVLRLPTAEAAAGPSDGWATTSELGSTCYRRLSASRYATLGGAPNERSEMAPLWLMEPRSQACGQLEDTRKAKRLITDDGVEMRSAHLSYFAFQDLCAGVELLRAALRRAAGLGFPTLFVAVAAPDAEAVCRELGGREVVAAPATIYGAGLEPGAFWNINTAEI